MAAENTKKRESSSEYKIRCANMIEADRTISMHTALIMFSEFEKKLRYEIALLIASANQQSGDKSTG